MNKQNINRLSWIDVVKGIAMLSVVLCHVANGFLTAQMFKGSESLLFGIQNITNAFQMALFCLASGYMFKHAYFPVSNTDNEKRLKRQIINTALLYLIWCILFGAFKILFGGSVNKEVTLLDFAKIFYKPIGVFWYFYLLVILYLLFGFFYIKKVNNYAVMVIVIISAILGCCLSDDVLGDFFMIRRILYYVPLFYLGIVLERTIEKKIFDYLAPSVALIGLGMLLLFWNNEKEIYHIPVVNMIVAVCISIFIFWLSFRITSVYTPKILSFVGKNSVEVYVFHVFFTAGSRLIIQKIGISNVYLSIMFAFFVSAFIPLMIGLFMKKIKIYDWFFKPLKSKKVLHNNDDKIS